jgi:A/G-specific adenine glycosylase
MSAARSRTKNPDSKYFIEANRARQIDSDLEGWFVEFQRDLTFRKTKAPYAIMVAEFMLQQTTVAAVEGYFPRFMARFPTVQALAEAPEDEVMAQWAGLGYYRRARQLHTAARAIMDSYGGVIPSNPVDLLRLPGVGRYTAGAIASTAFDVAAPILEANTIRVFSRLAGVDGVIGDVGFTKQLWQVAAELVAEARSPGVFNIAAMELGSLVCRPEPLCHACPVSAHCVAFHAGTASKIPQPAARRESVDVQMIAFVLARGDGQYIVRRIPSGQWHHGMYEFPAFRVPHDSLAPLASVEAAAKTLAASQLGAAPVTMEEFMPLRYQVTHHRIRLTVFRGMFDLPPGQPLPAGYQFLTLANISSLPMGSAQKKILKALMETER